MGKQIWAQTALRTIGMINVRVKDTVKLKVYVLDCPAGMFFADIFIPYENGHSVGAQVMIDMDNSFDFSVMHGIDRYFSE